MKIRGWLIVGASNRLPSEAYVGETVGELPDAANFLPGQWMFWRPVTAIAAGHPTQMAVVCVEMPLGLIG